MDDAAPDVALFSSSRVKKKRNSTLKQPDSPKKARVEDASQPAAADVTEPEADGAATADAVPATTTFRKLGLGEHLETTCSTLGMTLPTPVQAGVIPAILAGRDVIGIAQTGSGKTAAFALPILYQLSRERYGVFALALTPTRELAFQIAEQFGALGSSTGLRHAVVVGGMEMQAQALALLKRPHVVVATPGRLADMLANNADLSAAFTRTHTVVLDEADRLLDATFETDLASILKVVAKRRQTLLFTATMTPALEAMRTAMLTGAHLFRAYEGLQVVDGLRQNYVLVPAKVKEVYLMHVLENLEAASVQSVIIFCGTLKSCELLSGLLHQLGVSAASLYSSKKQKARLAALAQFKSQVVKILVATDVASRGLDIPTVDLVINFDLPVKAEDYIHRVGRTARAGRSGWALSLVTQYDIKLVQAIEARTGGKLTEHKMDEREVLKGITKVYAARRSALLAIQAKKDVV